LVDYDPQAPRDSAETDVRNQGDVRISRITSEDLDEIVQCVADLRRGVDTYMGHAAPAALVRQSGRRDMTFLEQDAVDFVQAASMPKEIRWYGADHNLNERARRDRMEWLQRQLGRQ
jgi:HD superfamily phosphodiesterase